MSRLARCLNIADLRLAARRRAHKMVFDYIDGAADDETTLAWNTAAFDRYAFRHRALVGAGEIDTSVELLGQRLAWPFFFSPAAGQRLFHTVGERAAATIAQEIGTAFCLSTLASVSIEDTAAIGPEPRWFQLYVWKDRGLIKAMLDRAKAAGFSALILTVDLPVHGNRERDPRNGFTIPPTLSPRLVAEAIKRPAWAWDALTGPPIGFANLDKQGPAAPLADFIAAQLDAGFSWREAEWLLGEWAGPSMIKGVVRDDDARRAVALGFDAIAVSNHGGRQLDTDIAPIDALPAIVDAVGGDAEIILDGGVRRGVHALKALALGASAVSFARPYLYGLAAGGVPGVRRAAEIMTSEITRAMHLVGARAIAELDASVLWDRAAFHDEARAHEL